VSDVLTQEEINALLSTYAKDEPDEVVEVAVASPDSYPSTARVSKPLKNWDFR
jgi:flagellar motor switch protein FliM